MSSPCSFRTAADVKKKMRDCMGKMLVCNWCVLIYEYKKIQTIYIGADIVVTIAQH